MLWEGVLEKGVVGEEVFEEGMLELILMREEIRSLKEKEPAVVVLSVRLQGRGVPGTGVGETVERGVVGRNAVEGQGVGERFNDGGG